MVMRMAWVYLIAAEAAIKTNNDGAAAANYLNQLRKRACRNPADFNGATGMQLTTAALNDVFDEYARGLCGEYYRWALLKRHKAFETCLQTYNRTAFTNFNPARHYNRPIPFALTRSLIRMSLERMDIDGRVKNHLRISHKQADVSKGPWQ